MTNFISSLDLENDTKYFDAYFVDQNAFNNSTFALYHRHERAIHLGPQYRLFRAYLDILRQPWRPTQAFLRTIIRYFTFAFGDTVISAVPTNFTATALVPFTNLLLATFTNGVPNSPTNNFAASINWGDNSINGGVIITNLAGRKEVRGSHTYTNAGNYPVYITVLSTFGASATVVSTGSVPPIISLVRTGTNNAVRWPAWATDYQLQSATNVAAASWPAVANFTVLDGYDSVTTNSTTNDACLLPAEKIAGG